MSLNVSLKRLKMLSLTACICLSAVCLTSCGNSDSSQDIALTTTSTAAITSSLTVTTAADKAETDDITSSVTTTSKNVSKTQSTTSQTSAQTTTSSQTQSVQSIIGTSSQSASGAVSSQTVSSSVGSTTTSSGSHTTTTTKLTTADTHTAPHIKPYDPLPDQAIDSRLYLISQISDAKLRNTAHDVMIGMQEGKNEIRIEDGVLKEDRLSDFIGFISMLESESYIIPSPYSYTVNRSGYVTSLKITRYPKTLKQYKTEKAAVDNLADQLVAEADKSFSTQFDKVLFFHDYIINNCTYDLSADNGASAYGCLIEGKAVCEGYAKAMMILCNRAGIECIPVTGFASNNGSSQSHMWDLIKIDGCWTHVDVTWDDIESRAVSAPCYSYLGLTDEQIRIDHTVNPSILFSTPKALSDSSSYYVRRGYYITSEDRIEKILTKAVNDAVKNSSETVTVRCASEALYKLASDTAASGSYEYEFIAELIKHADSIYNTGASADKGILIGDQPNAKATHTIMIFIKYDV